MDVRFSLLFSTGRIRNNRFTVAPRESLSVKMTALFGSQVADPTISLVELSTVCNGGEVPCAVSFFYLASPSCIPE
jgi:hypothetical protein